jgi:ribosomal protein S18 acetylase RimI-like enzyme
VRPPDVDFAIRRASAADLGNVIILWRAYQQELGIDLCFQGFEEELATLPGRYAPPAGCLLVATCRGQTAGCVGLRTLSPGRGEIKRMVVAPAWRRRGVAERLMQRLLQDAATMGLAEVVLDTLPSMTAARRLYAGFGFAPIAPYYETPLAQTVFLGRRLAG